LCDGHNYFRRKEILNSETISRFIIGSFISGHEITIAQSI
jgi:hypothetical protein